MSDRPQIVAIKTPTAEVNTAVVKEIEELLERAKKGEFCGLAWAATLPDGAVKTSWTRSIDFHALLSGATTLQWRMCESRNKEV